MQLYISLVIGDASEDGIRTTVATDPTIIHQDLVEFYTDALNDGGLPDEAPAIFANASTGHVVDLIENWVGRTVVLQESDLIVPR